MPFNTWQFAFIFWIFWVRQKASGLKSESITFHIWQGGKWKVLEWGKGQTEKVKGIIINLHDQTLWLTVSAESFGNMKGVENKSNVYMAKWERVINLQRLSIWEIIWRFRTLTQDKSHCKHVVVYTRSVGAVLRNRMKCCSFLVQQAKDGEREKSREKEKDEEKEPLLSSSLCKRGAWLFSGSLES